MASVEIVQREIDERRSAANDYDRLGRAEQAERLRREADGIAWSCCTR